MENIKATTLTPRDTNGSNGGNGRCVIFGDMVIATMQISITSQANAYTVMTGVPAPLYGAIIDILDVTNTYKFQVNQNGIFQNEVVLPAGKYCVNVAYIKK